MNSLNGYVILVLLGSKCTKNIPKQQYKHIRTFIPPTNSNMIDINSNFDCFLRDQTCTLKVG